MCQIDVSAHTNQTSDLSWRYTPSGPELAKFSEWSSVVFSLLGDARIARPAAPR